MPPILDVAIGTVFVFLLFSLVVSALNEAILSALDKRAAFLIEGLREIFRDNKPPKTDSTAKTNARAPKTPLVPINLEEFLSHGIITALSRRNFKEAAKRKPTDGVPSYIPGKSFVLALLGMITGQDPQKLKNLRATISGIDNGELKETLLALHDDAHGELDHFKANLENWYNESMDRVGGWYKNYAQRWLLGIGFVLAVVCNVDSVRIIRALSTEPALRASMVRQAENYSTEVASGAAAPASEEKIKKFKDSLAELGGTGIPMGWADGPSQTLISRLPRLSTIFSAPFWGRLFSDEGRVAISYWLTALIGWAVTGLAASLGAPFWFDLLNRFMDVRSVGRAPEESDRTAPKKRSTGVESYVKTGDSRTADNSTDRGSSGINPQGEPGPARPKKTPARKKTAAA